MSRPVLGGFVWLLALPADAQAAVAAPAPEIGAGFLGFLVAFAVAYLAERRSRRRS
ncbi:hypothetical protein [Methylocystis bryophila]|uniref:hypothetical protein n=1 Tax=Methylocystis bryophila TaxID=655015 RepID=UPI00131A1DB2|nr:hypothetical protein [Methylocystis bryophila]